MRPAARRVADLLRRMKDPGTRRLQQRCAVADELADSAGGTPTEEDVLAGVLDWKQRKQPPLRQDEVISAIQGLAMLGWLDVERSASLPVNEPELAGF